MLLSLWIGIVAAVICGSLVILIFYKLLRAIKVPQKASGVIGTIAGLIVGFMMVLGAGRVVIIKNTDDFGEYLVYGAPNYEFSNGYTLKLSMSASQGFLINDTEAPLVIEKYIYTDSYYNNSYDILCLPLSITKMPSAHISYYFTDRPPSSIRSDTDVTKYWVRTKTAYEREYGQMNFDKDFVSILAQPHNTASE
jgi:hypothetical protein